MKLIIYILLISSFLVSINVQGNDFIKLPVQNQYLEEFLKLPPTYRRNDEPPINFAELLREKEYIITRNSMVNKYSWAVPNQEAIISIKKHSTNGLIDFGAGNGYWDMLLSNSDVDVVAIDNWTDGPPTNLYFPVITGSFELLSQYKNRTLLLCWPPRKNLMALIAIKKWDGNVLCYIGEPTIGGFPRGNAEPLFFDELNKNWKLIEQIKIPQWFNRTDELFIYQRNIKL